MYLYSCIKINKYIIIMTILVTGGSGLVGSALKKITNIADNKFIFLSSKMCDLTDINDTKSCFEKYKPTYVIHLAAIAYGATSSSDDQYNSLINNSKINLNVFECCSLYKVKKIIACLSIVLSHDDTTFNIDSINQGPLLNGQFHQGYSHSKRLLHNLSVAYQNAKKGSVILLTPVNIYGYEDLYTSNRLIPSLLKQVKNKEICLAENSKRQLLYNIDFANIIYNFINLDDSEFTQHSLYPFIIGNPDILTIKKMVDIIANKHNINSKDLIFNEENNFSKLGEISTLPFKFNYTSFNDSINEIFQLISLEKSS